MSYEPPQYPQQGQPPYVPGQPQPYQPTQPMSAPPQYGAPQYGAPYPPPQPMKGKAGKVVLLTVGSLVALVLVVCVVGVIASAGKSDSKVKVQPPATAQAAKGDVTKTTEPADAPTDTDDSKAFNAAVGSTISITGDDGSEAEATLRSVKSFKKSCNEFAPDPENGVFVVVDVVVKQTKGTGSVNPLYFTFVADDGTTANSISGAFSNCGKPALDSTNSLHAGQKRAGKVTFDVTSSKGSVEFAPGGLGADAVGSWKVG